MSFAHFGLLAAGLAAVSIPIIIHLLFRQRRKPIEWAAMRFLLEAFRKQRRKLQIQQILLLLVRCLVVACVALALGRPLLRAAGLLGAGGGRDVYLVVDNSLASSVRDGNGPGSSLAAHKKAADQILASLGSGDRAGLVSLGAPAKSLVVPASSDLAAIRQLVDNLEPTDAEADFAGAFDALSTRLHDDREPGMVGRNVAVVLLSDFLKGSADLSRPLARSLGDLQNVTVFAARPTQVSVGNVQVVGIDPLRSVVLTGTGERSEDLSVWVRLRRTGAAVGESEVSTVRVSVSSMRGERSPTTTQGVVHWTPGQADASIPLQVRTDRVASEATTGVSGSASSAALIVAEIDRDSLDADNTMSRPVRVTDALDVGVIAQRRFGAGPGVDRLAAADWLRMALRPSDATPIEIVDIEPSGIDAPVLAALDAVFLATPELVPTEAWPKLRRFVDDGGVLIVSPAEGATVQLWSDAFTKAFKLDWQIAREPKTFPDDGEALGKDVPPDSLLSFLQVRDELVPLLEPVRVERSLPVTGVRESDVMLRLADGSPWLVTATPGEEAANGNGAAENSTNHRSTSRGMVVYLGSAPVLSWTDLPARPLMVPLIAELVRQGVGRAGTSTVAVAGVPAFVGPAATQVVSIDDPSRSYRVKSGLVAEPIRRSGVFRSTDETGRQIGVVAVNADVAAGRTEAQDPTAVSAWLSDALGESEDGSAAGSIAWLDEKAPGTALSPDRAGSPISLPLLIAALVLAIIEIFLARWFSHAFREEAGEEVPSATPGATAS